MFHFHVGDIISFTKTSDALPVAASRAVIKRIDLFPDYFNLVCEGATLSVPYLQGIEIDEDQIEIREYHDGFTTITVDSQNPNIATIIWTSGRTELLLVIQKH